MAMRLNTDQVQQLADIMNDMSDEITLLVIDDDGVRVFTDDGSEYHEWDE